MAEDNTLALINVLKRRISSWEKMLATPTVAPATKKRIADEVLWVHTAMMELSSGGPPKSEQEIDPNLPKAQNITVRTSSELTAEDEAEFAAIAARRAQRLASGGR